MRGRRRCCGPRVLEEHIAGGDELRVERDRRKSTLARAVDLAPDIEEGDQRSIGPHDPHAPILLRDEQTTVRREGKVHRFRQLVGDGRGREARRYDNVRDRGRGDTERECEREQNDSRDLRRGLHADLPSL
jgi:hypothetical protein